MSMCERERGRERESDKTIEEKASRDPSLLTGAIREYIGHFVSGQLSTSQWMHLSQIADLVCACVCARACVCLSF